MTFEEKLKAERTAQLYEIIDRMLKNGRDVETIKDDLACTDKDIRDAQSLPTE